MKRLAMSGHAAVAWCCVLLDATGWYLLMMVDVYRCIMMRDDDWWCMMCIDLCWFVMICIDLYWCVMNCYDTAYYDDLWCIMMIYEYLWCIMMASYGIVAYVGKVLCEDVARILWTRSSQVYTPPVQFKVHAFSCIFNFVEELSRWDPERMFIYNYLYYIIIYY